MEVEEEEEELEVITPIKIESDQKIAKIQNNTKEGMVEQSERIFKRSKKFLTDVYDGDLGMVRLEDVDKSPTDCINL